jgi:hypothetical protein
MKLIAREVYEFIKKRFNNDNSVAIHPFNHVTVLFYYRKSPVDDDTRACRVLGYHTDNIYSCDGSFLHSQNSQMENTFT